MASIPSVTVNLKGKWIGENPFLPDDIEEKDKQTIEEIVLTYMDAAYPPFEPEVVHRMVFHDIGAGGDRKDYFLPALKALYFDGQDFFSPSYKERWEDMELVAQCHCCQWGVVSSTLEEHKPPHMGEDCGIYGSVNIEEMNKWIQYKYEDEDDVRPIINFSWEDRDYPPEFHKTKGRMVLCIIEPSEDVDVILCRKGWKASKAFISEIIDETISIDDASNLLSMAWKRDIDVRGVYDESR